MKSSLLLVTLALAHPAFAADPSVAPSGRNHAVVLAKATKADVALQSKVKQLLNQRLGSQLASRLSVSVKAGAIDIRLPSNLPSSSDGVVAPDMSHDGVVAPDMLHGPVLLLSDGGRQRLGSEILRTPAAKSLRFLDSNGRVLGKKLIAPSAVPNTIKPTSSVPSVGIDAIVGEKGSVGPEGTPTRP